MKHVLLMKHVILMKQVLLMKHVLYSESNNIEFVTGNENNEIIENLFDSLFPKYQKDLEESMKGREFVFDCVNLLY